MDDNPILPHHFRSFLEREDRREPLLRIIWENAAASKINQHLRLHSNTVLSTTVIPFDEALLVQANVIFNTPAYAESHETGAQALWSTVKLLVSASFFAIIVDGNTASPSPSHPSSSSLLSNHKSSPNHPAEGDVNDALVIRQWAQKVKLSLSHHQLD